MEQKQRTHQRDDNELLDESIAQSRHRLVDEFRAVIGGEDFHALRQALLQTRYLRLDTVYGLERIFTRPHYDHAAHGFAFAVEFRYAPPNFGTNLHAGDIPKQYWRATRPQPDRDIPKIVQVFEVARGTHRVFGFSQLQDRAASFVV